jgi:lactate dehydrogenase-like 2-hydroxyacid dehydrogenase
MGYIGKALARLLKGFECTILYTKRTRLTAAEETEAGVRFAPIEEILQTADVVTLNCELNASTRNLINRETLALMKPDAILVNAARGGVMVEEDVAEAIRNGRLRGVGVDVFAIEPLPSDNPLIGLDRVITTPHVGAISADSFVPSITRMIDNLHAIARGENPNPIDVLV